MRTRSRADAHEPDGTLGEGRQSSLPSCHVAEVPIHGPGQGLSSKIECGKKDSVKTTRIELATFRSGVERTTIVLRLSQFSSVGGIFVFGVGVARSDARDSTRPYLEVT